MRRDNEPVQTESVSLARKQEGQRGTSCRNYIERNAPTAWEWRALEWACFVVLILLLMYGSGGIASNVINLRVWNSATRSSEAYNNPLQTQLMIGGQCLLCVAVICSLCFLFLFRNYLGLSLSVVLLALAAVFFLGMIIYLTVLILNDKLVLSTIMDYCANGLGRVGYMFEFYAYQQNNKCCGIRSYKDWKKFGPKILLVKDSVPESCCKDSLEGENRTNCGLKALISSENARKNINMKGCGKPLVRKYKTLFFRYIVEDAIVIVITAVAITLVILVGTRVWKQLHPKEHHYLPDPREQEDDVESDIIPGTPIKSYISSHNKTFYAL